MKPLARSLSKKRNSKDQAGDLETKAAVSGRGKSSVNVFGYLLLDKHTHFLYLEDNSRIEVDMTDGRKFAWQEGMHRMFAHFFWDDT